LANGIRGQQNAALRSQLNRSAMSIPANIVEGSGQESRREFGHFLGYAANSATELEWHLMVARDTGVINLNDYSAHVSRTVEVRKMLHGLMKRVALSASELSSTKH
jgi:four helix bundle protein